VRLTIAIIIVLSVTHCATGWAQEAENKAQQPVPPANQPKSELETCKPQPACRLMISPLVPSAPGGSLKAQGRGLDDERLRNWANRGPLDPRSFRLPAEIHT
jgi:hypothetical protein